MPTPVFQPYMPSAKEDVSGRIKGLTNAYIDTIQQLQWLLSHLDEKNVIRAKSVVADWVYAGTLTAEQINAVQGITLGANASIQWDELPSLPTAGQIGALPSDTPIPVLPNYIKSTYIDSTTVMSPNIIGGSIVGGSITSGSTININTDAIIGKNIYLGEYSDSTNIKSIYFNNFSSIKGNAETIRISAPIFHSDASWITGYWNFSNATVTGLDLVAKFG